ncbi:hypothetical protein JCM33374_g1431 [Metschnikowia sp. JCM 33374]|nr:hypothetical protein JCM33374_g1431 [Metschnikowia sp. JCM 33374]
MYYYIPEIKGPHYSMSIVDLLDRRFIDPLVTLLWVKNVVLQKLLAAADCTIAPIDDLLIFNRNLCAYHASVSGPERLPFLQYSLEYFCYIDQPSELRAKYGKARGTLNKIGSFFLSISSSFSQSVTLLPPDKIPNPPSRVSSGTPRSRVSSGDKNKTTRGSHGDKSSRVSSGASERKPHEKRSLFSGSRGGSARNSRNISPKELDLVFGSANETSQNKHPDMDLLKPYPISHLDTSSPMACKMAIYRSSSLTISTK